MANRSGTLAALGVPLLLIAGCMTDVARDMPQDDFISWEDYLALSTRYHNGKKIYLVEGDIGATYQQVRDHYERARQRYAQSLLDEDVAAAETPLTVSVRNGNDEIWAPVDAMNLIYCVSNEFGSDHFRAVQEMSGAAQSWESRAQVNFRYLATENNNCDDDNTNVTFAVRPWDAGGACAPFPTGWIPCGETGDTRTLYMDFDDLDTNSGYGNVNSLGVFRHELGHVLGLRHEHIRAPSTWCLETGATRSVTAYDSDSVMHYPWCPGSTNTGNLDITNLDTTGIQALYPQRAYTSSFANPTRNYRLAGGTNFNIPWGIDTANQFCIEAGYDTSSSYNLGYPTGSTYTRYTNGSWSVSGASNVNLMLSVTCAILQPEYRHFYSPTRSGIRIAGGYGFQFPWKTNTANQFCVEQGYVKSSSSSLNYPTGSTYTYYNGSSWGTSGRSDVHLFSRVTCVR